MTSIGERIQQVRGGTSRKKFAESIGIVENTLRNYEQGLSLPNSDVIAEICTTANISLDWLVFGTEPGDQGVLTKEANGDHISCQRCVKLEEKLDKAESQRDGLVDEVRQLWKENGNLKEIIGKLNTELVQLKNAQRKPANDDDSPISSAS